MSLIEAAIAAIESLEPGEQFIYRQIAREYGCSRAALAQRHKGVSSSRATQAEKPASSPPTSEKGALTLYQSTYKARLTIYTGYDTKFRLTDREKRAWGELG